MIINEKDNLSIASLRRSALLDPVLMRQLRRTLMEGSLIPVGTMSDTQLLDILAHWVEAGRVDPYIISGLVASLATPTLAGSAAGSLQETVQESESTDTTVTVPENSKDTISVLNTVEPKLELEYKVVLFDRKLSDYQGATEEKYFSDPTYIEVSATQTSGKPEFSKGAMLTASPANIEVFTDKKCEDKDKFDLSKPIPNEKLIGGKPYQLWLKGKTKGKFKLKLELEDPGDAGIIKKGPAEEEMSVVELEMKIHQHDVTDLMALEVDSADTLDGYFTNLKGKVIPDQKEMTDAEKVKDGRLLHVQNGHNFGRAKLQIKKLDTSQWAVGIDDYVIVLNQDNKSPGGGVALQDAEWDGNSVAFPVKMKVSDLKGADKEFWVEGSSAAKKLRDVRLELQLDRSGGGLAKEIKRNADWARFTVVKIEEVKLEYTPVVDGPVAWDSGQERFYINFGVNLDGRKITISAKLTEKLEDIVLHIMLAPDKDNTKAGNWGVAMPSTWKWKDIKDVVKHKDKDDPKNLLHLSDKTDADGTVKKELVLSRFGGDIFEPAAYIEQDPHLAKYVRNHAELKKRKPVVCTHTITVWRKIWYQAVVVKNMATGRLADTVGKYEPVKVDLVAADPLEITKEDAKAMNPPAVYPRYMIEKNGGDADALVVSDTNSKDFFTGFAAESDKPLKIPILVCDAQWDEDGDSGAKNVSMVPKGNFPLDVKVDKNVLIPPLQGGDLLVSGTWKFYKRKRLHLGWTKLSTEPMDNSQLSVNKSRNSLSEVQVSLPTTGVPADATHVAIDGLTVQGAEGFLGEYNPRTKRILTVHDPKELDDSLNTIVHELGHALHQVSEKTATDAIGVKKHPNQKDLGQGNHCRYRKNKCVMYDSGPIKHSLNKYCDICHPYLVVQDMTRFSGP